MLKSASDVIASEVEGLGINHIFALGPRTGLFSWGSWVEERTHFNKPGEMARACITLLYLVIGDSFLCTALTCRNLAQVSGGERRLRAMFSEPFNRACFESPSIMTVYSSYDGIPASANSRMYYFNHFKFIVLFTRALTELLTDIEGTSDNS